MRTLEMLCNHMAIRFFGLVRILLPTVAAFIYTAAAIPTNAASPESNTPETIHPAADGSFLLPAAKAQLFGDAIVHNAGRQSVENFKNPRDQAIWTLEGIEPGQYDVLVTWAVPDLPQDLWHQQKFIVAVDGKQAIRDRLSTTGGAHNFEHFNLGQLVLSKGQHRLTFRPDATSKDQWAFIRSLQLAPVRGPRYKMPPLTVADGFVIEPVAVSPIVEHPIMASFDEQGRLFIAESSGVNRPKPQPLYKERPHRMIMIEDTDGDGTFDKRTVFAENLVLSNGAQWYDGALYFCTSPFIWRYESQKKECW